MTLPATLGLQASKRYCFENECNGGKSMIVDGYKVLSDLKNDCPEFFKILTTFSVPFREFDEKMKLMQMSQSSAEFLK